MLRLLVVLSLAVSCLSTFSSVSRCDEGIIRDIRERFWNHGYCIPKNVLKTGEFLSSELVNVTTKDYYPNEKDIACVHTSIKGSVLKIYIHYANSTSSTSVINLIEKDGVLEDQENGIYRFNLYVDRNGVTPMYKCSKTGEIGDPEGAIKVSGRGYDEDAFAESVKDMASLGIIVSDKVYTDHCLPQKA